MQLGRYQILKHLATGDVADVLLARATGLEGFARHVVIKCIRKELAGEQRLVEAFVEEARIAAALHHQNVVTVHDIGEHEGAVFFAMEYVHGEDVRRLIGKVRERGEHVPIEHVVAIVSATAAGLHHAHEQRSPAGVPLDLVHRDVCPANILLGYDGSVKLVDFGMAKAALRSTKTAGGTLKGKAGYMAPEECMGTPVDRRTDTFALGIVLYELATAHRLFKGANEYLTMAAIVEGEIPPPSSHRRDLPPAFDAIVMRALARNPDERFQTAAEMREMLERFAVTHELRTSNKALADYCTRLFGQRLEPWHEDSQVQAAALDYDGTSGTGLAAVPAADDELIAKYAPRSTAPIMLAVSLAEHHDGGEGEERDPDVEETRNERPPPAGVDDPYSPTVIATPIFVDEESTVSRDEKAHEAAAALGIAPPVPAAATPADDDAAPTLSGDEPRRDPSPSEPPPLEEPPHRPLSEHIYVGPPAPPPSRMRTLLTRYQRAIVIGASASFVVVLVALLGTRACG